MNIFSVDILKLSLAVFIAMTPFSNAYSCEITPPPPEINVRIFEEKTTFDTDKTKNELTKIKSSSPIYSAYTQENMHGKLIGGMMVDALRMDHEINSKQYHVNKNGYSCFQIDKINIDIHLSPKIYIAKEFVKNDCWFNHILSHELQHLDIDRDIADKYRRIINNALKISLSNTDRYWSGPVKEADIIDIKERKKSFINTILRISFDKIKEERAARQSAIDKREDEHPTSSSCPNVREL